MIPSEAEDGMVCKICGEGPVVHPTKAGLRCARCDPPLSGRQRLEMASEIRYVRMGGMTWGFPPREIEERVEQIRETFHLRGGR